MVTEQLPEVIELEEQPVDGPENYSELTHSFRSCTNNYNVVSEEPTTAPKSCTQMNLVNALPNPVEKFPSQTMHNNSSDSNLGHRVQDGKTMEDENFTINSPSPSGSVDDSVMTDVENVKEEQFLFSDIDESKVMVIQTMESKFPGNMDRETSSMCCQEGIKELNESAIEKKESYSCSEISDQENLTSDFENSVGITRASSNSLCIPKCHSISGNEVRPLAKSLPNMRSYTDNCGTYDVHLLSRSLDSNSISSKWTLQSKDDSTSRKSNEDIEPQLALEPLDIKDAPVLGELELEHEHEHANPAVGKKTWIPTQKYFYLKGLHHFLELFDICLHICFSYFLDVHIMILKKVYDYIFVLLLKQHIISSVILICLLAYYLLITLFLVHILYLQCEAERTC